MAGRGIWKGKGRFLLYFKNNFTFQSFHSTLNRSRMLEKPNEREGWGGGYANKQDFYGPPGFGRLGRY